MVFHQRLLVQLAVVHDFWKASLVSVKILVEAAFVVSTAFKAF